MKPILYSIQTALSIRLAIVARPRGADWLHDEIQALADEKFDILISMLTQQEVEELNLEDERSECNKAGIRFVNIPVQDRSVPTNSHQFLTALEELAAELRAGKSIAVHCRACIGRSSVLAASLLVCLGMPPQGAFQRIQAARGCPCSRYT